jgi:TonB family protein
MTELKKKKKKTPYQSWLVPGIIGLVFLAGIGFVVRVMLTDVGPRRKEQIQTVTLLKPPPPPEVKEKPPEPEVPKEAPKQTIETPSEAPQDQPQNQSDDNTPAGSDLGVDADGGAGSDGFGLVGKKGGRAITLGGGGGGMNRLNLLAKYGRYVQKVQDEIRAQVNRQLEQDGGIPKGKYHTLVKITLNSKGSVVTYKITGSSGQQKIDKAVREALAAMRISEVPPDGMPSGMTIKITSQG